MNIELLPNLTNVIRFPVEDVARPSYELLTEIEPDVREVMLVAEAFQLEGDDPGRQDATDHETAAYIAEQIVPVAGTELGRLLDELMEPATERAVLACRAAHRSSVRTATAQQKLNAAQVNGGSLLEALEVRAETSTNETAKLLIEAAARCAEVRGMRRAVDLAKEGKPWTPNDRHADQLDWLADIERRRQERSTAN